MSTILELKGVKKHFHLPKGRVLRAVDGIDIAVGENEVVGLVGESGCGKSTLGRTIVGLYERTEGEVAYRGERLPSRYRPSDFFAYARKIHMIFQDPYSALNPRMTVREILAEGPLIHRMWQRSQVAHRAGAWLERVGLSGDHLSRYPHEFSGGQRQRIGIARALALEPEIVICDEPISALDVSVQAQVVNLLDDLKMTMGLTLVFIAHDVSMIRYISNRIAVMYLGQLVELGPSDEVYFRPQHPYTQSLIASNPEPDPLRERSRPRPPVRGEIPSPLDLKPGCHFAERCPLAFETCKERAPAWREVRPGHFAACHLLEREPVRDTVDPGREREQGSPHPRSGDRTGSRP